MRNNISTNTLFHFTQSLSNIASILSNNFYPRFCPEDSSVYENKTFGGYPLFTAIPMVCFCDIPLSQIRNHIDIYGKYAIGLSKDWGISNNINPVMYLLSSTNISKTFMNIISIYLANHNKSKKRDELYKLSTNWLYQINYIKPYEGFLRKGTKIVKKRFYDEREWRYVPTFEMLKKMGLPINEALNNSKSFKKLAYYNKMLKDLPLLFELKDIKYIIVEKENEIFEMIRKIKDIKGLHCTHNDVEILITRIISMEQILSDF